jgi:Xaa-Pro aminopeptidase
METHFLENRISYLREQIAGAGMRAAILSRPQHIFYFTGVMPGPAPALLLVTQTRTLGIAPAPLGAVETLTYVDYDIHKGWNVFASVAELLDRALTDLFPIGRIVGLELDHFPAIWMPIALRHLRETRPLKDLLWKIECNKDSQELQQIATNVAGNDRIFQAVQAALRPGMPELELWSVVQNGLNQNGGGPVLLEADLGASVKGSNPDAKPGNETLKQGETVFIDIYSNTHGYYADTTRVFALGHPSQRHKEVFGVLQAALQAGIARLLPGTPANQVDAAVRGVIERAGYGENFPHHSGHAYGLFQQERPYFIPAETTPLEAGMVVTLEPGIYIPGWGGMRLEGNFVIEPNGARRLDSFPSDLVVCG